MDVLQLLCCMADSMQVTLINVRTALQSQKAVSAYFTKKDTAI